MSKAKRPLGLVHTSVCGLINLCSYGRSKYFLLFIDDYSKAIWVYFLKEKLEAFKKFKPLIEKESDMPSEP